MNYTGPLYGKIGRKYIPLKLDSAAVDALVSDNEKLRDRAAAAGNEAVLLQLQVELMNQDLATLRQIIAKGGSPSDILKFLDTPEA
jgi:hypothetical protein